MKVASCFFEPIIVVFLNPKVAIADVVCYEVVGAQVVGIGNNPSLLPFLTPIPTVDVVEILGVEDNIAINIHVVCSVVAIDADVLAQSAAVKDGVESDGCPVIVGSDIDVSRVLEAQLLPCRNPRGRMVDVVVFHQAFAIGLSIFAVMLSKGDGRIVDIHEFIVCDISLSVIPNGMDVGTEVSDVGKSIVCSFHIWHFERVYVWDMLVSQYGSLDFGKHIVVGE